MAIIVPAILPASRHDLDEKLARLIGIASDVQVDVVDGRFATPASWPYAGGSNLTELAAEDGTIPLFEQFHVEMDLMTEKPEEVTGSWIAAGATRILAHLESTTYLPELVTDLRVKYGHEKGFASDSLSFGLALNIDSDLALLEPYIGDIDYVQFMGIKNIGKQGQPFSTEVLNKIAVFRKRHPDTEMQVDGGVNFESAPLLLAAGVSRLVVGSALWKAPNLKEAFEKLIALTEEHGLYA
jgi:ribulose-phosphate 3-epimerase